LDDVIKLSLKVRINCAELLLLQGLEFNLGFSSATLVIQVRGVLSSG